MARGTQTAAFRVAKFVSWTSVPSVQLHSNRKGNLNISVVFFHIMGRFAIQVLGNGYCYDYGTHFLVHPQTQTLLFAKCLNSCFFRVCWYTMCTGVPPAPPRVSHPPSSCCHQLKVILYKCQRAINNQSLQEVVWGATSDVGLPSARRWIKLQAG